MSKESDNKATPDWIMDMYKDWYDPCPLNPNWTTNGLKTFWGDRAYVNPPYSDITPWIEKAIEENKRGCQVVLLLPLDCSTKWFRLLMTADPHILLINERVKFTGTAPKFCCALFVLDKEKSKVEKK